jgi:hypothetical protein
VKAASVTSEPVGLPDGRQHWYFAAFVESKSSVLQHSVVSRLYWLVETYGSGASQRPHFRLIGILPPAPGWFGGRTWTPPVYLPHPARTGETVWGPHCGPGIVSRPPDCCRSSCATSARRCPVLESRR